MLEKMHAMKSKACTRGRICKVIEKSDSDSLNDGKRALVYYIVHTFSNLKRVKISFNYTGVSNWVPSGPQLCKD